MRPRLSRKSRFNKMWGGSPYKDNDTIKSDSLGEGIIVILLIIIALSVLASCQ